jgi:hypothetical protein
MSLTAEAVGVYSSSSSFVNPASAGEVVAIIRTRGFYNGRFSASAGESAEGGLKLTLRRGDRPQSGQGHRERDSAALAESARCGWR